MMMKNVRILVAAAACVLLGMPLLAEEPVPVIQGMGAEAGPSGPVLRVSATGELETVHYSPQPGVWVIELPEASWETWCDDVKVAADWLQQKTGRPVILWGIRLGALLSRRP